MKKNTIFYPALFMMIYGCGTTAIVTTPVENIDNSPLKVSDLSQNERQNWMHLDLVTDTIPGMSVDRAYREIIKGKKGKTVVVAVIDSGIDINHEDLDGVIWRNTDEIANNGKDDDNNGYVDDVHGWNFLGETYNEQLEYVRLLSSGNSSDPRYSEAKAEYDLEYQKYSQLKSQYDQVIQQFDQADNALKKHLNKGVYGKNELNGIKTQDQTLLSYVGYMKFILGNGFETNEVAKNQINSDTKQIYDFLNYHLNKSHKGRKTGDDPNNFSQKIYGNNNVSPAEIDENHGTHVAGVIAAKRNNNLGGNGIANNVKIMALRTVPNGDEYDKDVALAIRYAVDNGASIINMSFGKYYSPNPDWVRDAIVYAAEKDVLLVTGSGNESLDLDKKIGFPTDVSRDGLEVADNYINVGALNQKYGSSMVANYSNYGKNNVDIFAPGSAIYSPKPENKYDFIDGTSFASPAVAGIAALIRSQYPSLSASEVKQVLLDSGLTTNIKVVVAGDTNNVKEFKQLSKSGKMINAYNALILASQKRKK